MNANKLNELMDAAKAFSNEQSEYYKLKKEIKEIDKEIDRLNSLLSAKKSKLNSIMFSSVSVDRLQSAAIAFVLSEKDDNVPTNQ